VGTGPQEQTAPRARLPFILFAVATVAVVFAEYFRRPPGRSIDTWAYTVHGQALTRGETPPFDQLLTTPKPLASLLATITAPLPPEWGLGLVTTLATAALLIALLLAGYRWGGTVGAVAAPSAFMLVGRTAGVINGALIDVVTPACLVCAVLSRGYLRVAWITVAGLLHPFVWPLTGFAGWQAVGQDGAPRRWTSAVGGLIAAPALWLVTDLIITGDLFATPRWMLDYRTELLGDGGPDPVAAADLPAELSQILAPDLPILIVTVLGGAGLVLAARRSNSGADADPLPLAAAGVWLGLLAVYVALGASMHQRYLLPSSAMFAIGIAKIGGSTIRRVAPGWRDRDRMPAVLVALAIVATFLWTSELDGARMASADRHDHIQASRDAIEAGLACGTVGFAGTRFTGGIVGEVAATFRSDLASFGTVETNEENRLADADDHAAIFRLHRSAGSLPWRPIYRTEIGRVAYAPSCEAPGGLDVYST
jgi:hypothetical protein